MIRVFRLLYATGFAFMFVWEGERPRVTDMRYFENKITRVLWWISYLVYSSEVHFETAEAYFLSAHIK
jgi:hypothetical protein